VLPLAVKVSEFEINQLYAFVLDLTKDLLRGFGHVKRTPKTDLERP
jgi:hypothetical protein